MLGALTLSDDGMIFQILLDTGTYLNEFYMLSYMPTKHHKSSWTKPYHQAYKFYEGFYESLYYNFLFVHLLVFVKAWLSDVSFLCVVKTQRRWPNKIYKTELTKKRYNNLVFGKYRVDPQRAGLTLIAELTWSNLGLKGVLNERK